MVSFMKDSNIIALPRNGKAEAEWYKPSVVHSGDSEGLSKMIIL